MSKKWIIPLVAVLTACAAAYSITRCIACGRDTPSVDHLQDLSFLARELHLSNAQITEIRQLHATLGKNLNDSCRLHCAARARLGAALATDTNGTAQADAVLADMCQAYELSERATLQHIRAMRAVLNAEQVKRFDVLISQCMCQPCNMHDSRCGADTAGTGSTKP
ncbi:MAG: periplasmic heavy metal sensor [Kiritimatiellia bacterium]